MYVCILKMQNITRECVIKNHIAAQLEKHKFS